LAGGVAVANKPPGRVTSRAPPRIIIEPAPPSAKPPPLPGYQPDPGDGLPPSPITPPNSVGPEWYKVFPSTPHPMPCPVATRTVSIGREPTERELKEEGESGLARIRNASLRGGIDSRAYWGARKERSVFWHFKDGKPALTWCPRPRKASIGLTLLPIVATVATSLIPGAQLFAPVVGGLVRTALARR